MKNKNLIAIFGFSVIGVLFSGTLTLKTLFSGTCPLTESCPYLLGYPVCVYGLIMYLALLGMSSFLLFGKHERMNMKKGIVYVSLVGIIFSLYYTLQELFFGSCPPGGCEYSLLLPTCVYGLLMYLIVFGNAIYLLKK